MRFSFYKISNILFFIWQIKRAFSSPYIFLPITFIFLSVNPVKRTCAFIVTAQNFSMIYFSTQEIINSFSCSDIVFPFTFISISVMEYISSYLLLSKFFNITFSISHIICPLSNVFRPFTPAISSKTTIFPFLK